MNRGRILATFLVVPCLAASCAKPKRAPKLIEADGQAYAACHNFVWIASEDQSLGHEAGFEVSFTDANGLREVIQHVQTLTLSDLPEKVPALLPFLLPDSLRGTDPEGNPFKEGNTYTWSDGSQAVLNHGEWKPVMRPNPACQPKVEDGRDAMGRVISASLR